MAGEIKLEKATGGYYYGQMVEHIQRAQAKLLALKDQLENKSN